MLVEVTTIDEFFAEHTKDGPAARLDTGEFVFPDGARCDSACDVRHDPSTNEHERLTDQLQWCDASLAAAVLRFDQFRQQLVDQAQLCLRYDNPLPPPTDEEIAALEEMRAECEALLKRHHELMRALHRTAEATEQRQRERREESRKAGVRRVLDKLMQIKAPVSLAESTEPVDPLLEAERLVRQMTSTRPTAGAVVED